MYNLKICYLDPMLRIIMTIIKMNFKSQILHLILTVQISHLIKMLKIPVRNVEEQDIIHNTEQDTQYLIQGSSTLSTTKCNIPQPPIQPPISKNYDPTPPPESDTYTSSSTSQQPSTFNNNINGLINNTRLGFTFQSPLTPEGTLVTTHPYTQAQNSSDPNIPTTFNFNMIHTNPPPIFINCGTLSRPPLQTISTNPLQYISSSTNIHNTQHSIYSLEHNTQTVTSTNSIQHQNIPVPSTSSIRTNPCFTPTSQIPTNTNKLQTNTSHSNYHITLPYTQPSTTISNPTYISTLLLLVQNQSNHLMVLIINIHLKNIYNTLKLVLHFL